MQVRNRGKSQICLQGRRNIVPVGLSRIPPRKLCSMLWKVSESSLAVANSSIIVVVYEDLLGMVIVDPFAIFLAWCVGENRVLY